jgi:hypothetical protein
MASRYQPPRRKSRPDKRNEASLEARRLVDRFISKNSRWFGSAALNGIVYSLPQAVIKSLASPDAHRFPVISSKLKEVESEFRQLCDACQACGFRGTSPVYHPCLNPLTNEGALRNALRRISQPILFACDQEQAKAEAREIEESSISITHWERQSAYVGWLMCNDQFLETLRCVQQSYNELDVAERPAFPLLRDYFPREFQIEGRAVRSAKRDRFHPQLNALMDGWNLQALMSWELPLPFDPRIADGGSATSTPMPPHAVVVMLPLHYPLTQADELAVEILRRQASLAAERKMGNFIPLLTKHEMWGKIFLVQHWERIIRSRYLSPLKKGAISSLETALGAGLQCGRDYVVTLRRPVTKSRTVLTSVD